MDSRLSNLYRGYHNEDPAPKRVKPLPMTILHHADATLKLNDNYQACLMDMAWLAVFYLLGPGEYCKSTDNHPLTMQDGSLSIGHNKINALTCPLADLRRSSSSSLTFDDQKNRERGEVIAQALSGHRRACPTRALARRIEYLRSHNAPPDTPLCAVYKPNGRLTYVTSTAITKALQVSAAALPHLGFPPDEVTARSMRAGGVMALLCGKVDADTIRLVGRWKSDAMFRYLHAQALPLVNQLARTMLPHGNFNLAPGADYPARAEPILAAAE
jgi:hypothetical protein